ncbi:MAG: hypothetical protein IID16_03585 [Candidatus Marinimicrobia bacterium]|nr:hypothetical protein [Candidatus Neomarinimicrobiota bacterium]
MRLLIAYTLWTSALCAAFERVPLSFSQTACGLSNFMPTSSPITFFSHPANLARSQSKSVAMFFEAPFQITKLHNFGAGFTMPLKFGRFGVGFHALGNNVYRESTVTIGAGKKFGDYFEAGLVINGNELSIKNYGSTRTVSLSASLNYSLSETIQWSLLYQNFNGPKLGKTDELLPQVIAMGFVFSPTSTIQSVIELERDLEFETRYKFGVLWQLFKSLTLATGFINHPAQMTTGISFKIKGQRISYAFSTHPELAFSQLLTIQFSLP